MGTDICALVARQFFAWCKTGRFNGLALYVDVISAFDAVIRELLSHAEVLDSQVAAAVKRLGFGPDVMHALAEHIAAGSVLSKAGMSRHAVQLRAEAHEDIWFTTQGCENPVST